ncbi:MAG: hypothetical protein WBH40_13230 [Ignavibacteriaceae bacterium]
MKRLVIILLLFSAVSCDIFETRDAESPDQSRSNYRPATSPEILIQNLIDSFADKDVVNYQNTFVTGLSNRDFIFVPSSTASSRFQNLWPTWNIDAEVQYFNNMKTSVPDELPVLLSGLSLSPESFSIFGDSLKYNSEYFISIPQINSEPLIFQGNLELSMINVSTLWEVYFWKDNAIEDNPSWSDLKGSVY